MIIDSHCHAWTTWPYDASVPDPTSRGTVGQLLFEMDRNEVERAVVICARIDHNPDNNDHIAGEVARHPDRLVQFADVDSEWSPEYHTPGAADRLRAAIERYRVSGFTHYIRGTDDGWFTSEEGLAFFEVAASRDLIASIALAPDWMGSICRIADRYPTMPILLHHQGMVLAKEGPANGLERLLEGASHPNVLVKASGFYYGSAAWAEYPYPDQMAVFARIVEAYGPRRLVWGSDFPVAPWVACTYRQALDIVRVHAAELLPGDDLAWVLGGTLDRVLRTRRPVA